VSSTARIIRRRKARQMRKQIIQSRSRLWLIIAFIIVMAVVVIPAGAAIGGAVVIYNLATHNLPTPEQTVAQGAGATGSTQLFDRTGQTLLFAAAARPEHAWVALKDLPPYVSQATLTVEDPKFLTAASSVPISQTFLRLWRNMLFGPLPPDSTLTGRLVRNVIAPLPEVVTTDDISREIAVVADINRRYAPEKILEWYLNTNYYGSEAYGIEAAAGIYFGKQAADLTLDEAALLAPIPLAPQYNPFDNETAARGRQADALRAMRAAGNITSDQFERAAATLTPVQTGTSVAQQIAPEFTIYARRQAETILDSLGRNGARLVAQGGLKITTSLDLDLYYQSECALRTQMARLNGKTTSPNTLTDQPCLSAHYLPPPVPPPVSGTPDTAALVIMDAATGELRSVVGPAAALVYQPGPTLLPFVYFTGFINTAYTPASMVLDVPTNFPGAAEGLIYSPTNADGKFRGPVNLRDAMAAGLLPPAVQVARNQSLANVLRIAHRIGLNSLDDTGRYDLSLLERGGTVSLLDTTYAYSVFATMGDMRGIPVNPVGRGYRQRNPVAILKIEDSDGKVLWQYDDKRVAQEQIRVFPLSVGYLVNNILADQEKRRAVLGDGNIVEFPRTAAVVNGLTGDHSESWTVGYTAQLVTGVHIGRQDRQPMLIDAFGLQAAAPVWRAVMQYAHDRDALPTAAWERPTDIVEVPVCERSGLLASTFCPAHNEIFLQQAQPAQIDTYWQTVEMNTQTMQRATANTPRELRSQTVFFIPPPDAAEWWKTSNLPLPPTDYDSVIPPQIANSLQITQPAQFAYVGRLVEVHGTFDTTNLKYFQLAYGQGPNPTEWSQIGDRQTKFNPGDNFGTWDTTGLNGLYNLLLTVVRIDNSIETRTLQVTVDNAAPTISLSAGEPGKVYRSPQDKSVTIEATVKDDYAIDRVEFYHNGALLTRVKQWPYTLIWDITQTGTENFTAVAFDAAGNAANADITIEIKRG
jgi:membrane peptidoglycan carboxypeptidase